MSTDLDIDYLLNAINNDNNESIIKLDSRKIKEEKNNILQKLQLGRDNLKMIHKKLKYYRYVEEMPDINYGSYIRWIRLTNPENIKLTNGGIICDIKVHENGIHIVCKNNMNRLFQIKMDENLIFQKFTPQEEILLQVMDYLNKD
jgi:hypothetical protein